MKPHSIDSMDQKKTCMNHSAFSVPWKLSRENLPPLIRVLSQSAQQKKKNKKHAHKFLHMVSDQVDHCGYFWHVTQTQKN